MTKLAISLQTLGQIVPRW